MAKHTLTLFELSFSVSKQPAALPLPMRVTQFGKFSIPSARGYFKVIQSSNG